MLHGDWLALRATAHPRRPAIVDVDRDVTLDYATLSARADRAAAALSSLGVQAGDRVAVLSGNRPELVELLFACGRLGAVLVPLNWRLALAELLPVAVDAAPALLLVGDDQDARRTPLADALDCPTLSFDRPHGGHPAWSVLAADAGAPPPRPPIHEATPWLMLYTSGSTGRPKGALLTHGSVTWNCVNTRVGWSLRPDETTLVHTPLFHTGGWNVLLLPLLHGGGTVLLGAAFDPDQTLDLVAEHAITVLFAVPTMYTDLLAAQRRQPRDLSSLRFAISGGAPCPLPLIEGFGALGVPLKQGYGLTEVGPNCFFFPDGQEVARCGSVGLPMPHLEVRLVDEHDVPVGVGEVGELQLRGPTVCAGYWRNPEATLAAQAEGGWFRTGDLLTRDADGWFSVVGRRKEMFISGGENVYPAEVERVLYALPGVMEAAVVPVPDPRWGEVGHAFISLDGVAAPLGPDAVRALCREQLAGYKVPKRVTVLPELPKGPTGKIARLALTPSRP